MSGFDLLAQQGVLDWAGGVTLTATLRGEEPTASAIAKAMRYKAVWEAHRNTLTHICGTQRYSTVNRQTMVKSLRAFICAMERAEGAGNE